MNRQTNRRLNPGSRRLLAAFAALAAAPALAEPPLAPATMRPATTYHVDFANGSDTADGLSPETAWKRAPGDSRAGAIPRTTRLQPGDTVLFRGGVAYRGTIVVRAAGTPDAPIRYIGDGWGPSTAILDGSEPSLRARPCRSARDCGGEPGWAGLHRLSLSGDTFLQDGLFQQDQPLVVASADAPILPGTARQFPGTGGRIVLVHPLPGIPADYAQGAGRVGFLLVTGGHVRIRGFRAARFAPAPRFGPYAGTPLVQLQPLEGVGLAAFQGQQGIRLAPPVGPAIAGVTSGPV
jgi:hypothetical protein